MAVDEFDSKKLDNYFRGEGTDTDEDYLFRIFCDKQKEAELTHYLRKQWYELINKRQIPEKDLDHILYKIHYNLSTKKAEHQERTAGKIMNWSLRIAGIIIMPLAIFWGIKGYLNNNSRGETWAEIHAPAWTRTQFSLPDGTTGWLNSNSSLRYKGNYSKDRQVSLTGEAFFDVSEVNKKPFSVNTNDVIVKVLGTRFNIASYENERNVEVALEEGKLIFSDKKTNKSWFMKPNDLVIYDRIRNEFSSKVVEPQKYSSWTEGKLVFRNDPLDVIARRLERWYNVEIEVKGNVIRDPRLRATFKDETLEEVLDLLKPSLMIDFKIINRYLKSDGIYTKKKVIITVNPKIP